MVAGVAEGDGIIIKYGDRKATVRTESALVEPLPETLPVCDVVPAAAYEAALEEIFAHSQRRKVSARENERNASR
jgi:hypothetical protein